MNKQSSRPTALELWLERNATFPGNVTRLLHLIVACLLVAARSASATPCQFESQGEGRVAAIDARSLRLDDGREIRLTGIEPTATTKQALTTLLVGRDVILRSADDTPDRYGRQGALVFVGESDISVQATLLAEGDAIVSAEIADKALRGRPDGGGGRGKAPKKGQLG